MVRNGEPKQEGCHHGEPHQLNGETADGVYQRHGEPVTRHGAAERDECLSSGDLVNFLERVHGGGLRKPADSAKDVFLKEVLAVESDVEEKPSRRGADEVEAVATNELLRKQPEAVSLSSGHFGDLLLLLLDFDLENLGHVGSCLLGVVCDEGGVPGGLRHLHPPVVGEQSRGRAEHEDDSPHVVGLRNSGPCSVVVVVRRVVLALEPCGDDEGDDAPCEVTEPLHREHGCNESAAGFFISVFGHDGGGKRIVAADAETEPEAEEAEGSHNAFSGVAEGETGGDGAYYHEHEGHAVNFFAAHLVAEPTEEELTCESAAERDAIDCGGDVGWEAAWCLGVRIEVVDAAEELGDQRDAEQIVSVGEESHSGDDDGLEVVQLGFGQVKLVKNLEISGRHG
ncbi:hypothetical protein M5K25_017172 [Dendrobium thyrsiflorum]|uniref:Uncharacterized protein n=1 Tax=Dendrobium thyrsiflorum TaxID=117978 RepID=A0ABD0ULV0_DENTH